MKKMFIMGIIVVSILFFSCENLTKITETGDNVNYDYRVMVNENDDFELYNPVGNFVESNEINNFLTEFDQKANIRESLSEGASLNYYIENPNSTRSGQQDNSCDHHWGSGTYTSYNHIHWFMKSCHVEKYSSQCSYCGLKRTSALHRY